MGHAPKEKDQSGGRMDCYFGSPNSTKGVLGTGLDIAGMKSGPGSGVSPDFRQLCEMWKFDAVD